MLGERALEVLVHLCGFSAIIFVLGIFVFVFKEALPVLWDEVQSQPVHPERPMVSYFRGEQAVRVLAMIAGTFSVTALAMLLAVRSASGRRFTFGILQAASPRNSEDHHRIARRHPERGLGFHWLNGHEVGSSSATLARRLA
jgi:phosphate transport system permease protein